MRNPFARWFRRSRPYVAECDTMPGFIAPTTPVPAWLEPVGHPYQGNHGREPSGPERDLAYLYANSLLRLSSRWNNLRLLSLLGLCLVAITGFCEATTLISSPVAAIITQMGLVGVSLSMTFGVGYVCKRMLKEASILARGYRLTLADGPDGKAKFYHRLDYCLKCKAGPNEHCDAGLHS